MKEKFIEFLKTHKAHSRYVRNAKNSNLTLDIITKTSKDTPQGWIARAFTWIKTPEGHDYWRNLDNYWREELCSN